MEQAEREREISEDRRWRERAKGRGGRMWRRDYWPCSSISFAVTVVCQTSGGGEGEFGQCKGMIKVIMAI